MNVSLRIYFTKEQAQLVCRGFSESSLRCLRLECAAGCSTVYRPITTIVSLCFEELVC
jgi:hypothetical protein